MADFLVCARLFSSCKVTKNCCCCRFLFSIYGIEFSLHPTSNRNSFIHTKIFIQLTARCTCIQELQCHQLFAGFFCFSKGVYFNLQSQNNIHRKFFTAAILYVFFLCAALNEHEYEYKTNPALRFWPRLWLLWLFSFLYRMTNVFLMKSVSTIYWILLCIWCWSEIEHIPNDSKWRSIFQVIF